MQNRNVQAVTGAFGFSGRYIAERLLEEGHAVKTLTNSPGRGNPFKGRIEACPFSFDDPRKTVAALEGAAVLYNNYWVRFNYRDHASFTYAEAVENSLKLFRAAKEAGVGRIVHVSITNPSEDSPFEYFRGKAMLERALKESGMSYAILRPAVLFGEEDILINNIAWMLRTFPVFGVFGDGRYRLQPIYVGDLATLAVEQGAATENVVIDAVGPETFTYRELVKVVGDSIGRSRPVISIPPSAGFLIGNLMGKLLRDVTITRDEIEGLMAGLLYTGSPPAGTTRLTAWIREHSDTVGMKYHSELARRTNRTKAYGEL